MRFCVNFFFQKKKTRLGCMNDTIGVYPIQLGCMNETFIVKTCCNFVRRNQETK